MASLNRASIIGYIGRDPELSYACDGQPVLLLVVATSERIKGVTGGLETRTEWHWVVVQGRQAELIAPFLGKGTSIYLDGRLQTRKWQDAQGNDRYRTEIVCDRVQRLGGSGAKVQIGGFFDDK